MKNLRNFFLCAIVLLACSKKSNTPDVRQCDFATNSITASATGTVMYKLSYIAPSTVSSITYKTSSGDVTLNNPPNNFERMIEVAAGTVINISAKGTTSSSTIYISYDYMAGSTTISNQQTCGN